jgi:hypothetical protein
LEDDDQDDIRRLATKADRMFTLHGHKNGEAVAVVERQEDEEEAAGINAVQGVACVATTGAAVSGAASEAGSASARGAACRAARVGISSRADPVASP